MTTLFELPPIRVTPIKQSIPDVGQDLDSHTRVLRAIKEAVELGQRLTPEIMRSFVTVQDLVNLNLLRIEGTTLAGPQVRKVFPTPINNWGTSTSIAPFSVYKTLEGRVYIDGELNFINFGSVSSVIAFVLPVGFRPPFTVSSQQYVRGSTRESCSIADNGEVTLGTDPLTFLNTGRFTGIHFPAA